MTTENREKVLQEITRKWQEILGMQAWDITIKFARLEKFNTESTGEIHYNAVTEQALILILDPVDYSTDDFIQDIEKTVVHELLHALLGQVMDTMDEETLVYASLHRVLNRISKGLVTAARLNPAIRLFGHVPAGLDFAPISPDALFEDCGKHAKTEDKYITRY